MAEPLTLTKSEYKDLQRRYVGLDWPDDAGETLDAILVVPRMGVPIEELAADLAQLRLQKENTRASIAFRDQYLEETKVSGKKGIAYFLLMLGFCMIIFAVLMLSVKVLVPKGRNLQDKTPTQETSGTEIMPQPGG